MLLQNELNSSKYLNGIRNGHRFVSEHILIHHEEKGQQKLKNSSSFNSSKSLVFILKFLHVIGRQMNYAVNEFHDFVQFH